MSSGRIYMNQPQSHQQAPAHNFRPLYPPQQEAFHHNNAPEIDLSNMRKRLDGLLKQADLILPADRKDPPATYFARSPNGRLQIARPQHNVTSPKVGFQNKNLSYPNLPVFAPSNQPRMEHGRPQNMQPAVRESQAYRRDVSLTTAKPVSPMPGADSISNSQRKPSQYSASLNPENLRSELFGSKERSTSESRQVPVKKETPREFQKEAKSEIKAGEPEISWTKYLLMEFKNEELQGEVKKLTERLNSSEKQIRQLQEQISTKERQAVEKITALKKQHESQLSSERQLHESKVNEKNEHIRELVRKQTETSKKEQDSTLEAYINDLVEENRRLTEKLRATQIKQKEQEARLVDSEETLAFVEEERKAHQNELRMAKESYEKVKALLAARETPFEEVLKVQMEESKMERDRFEILQQENMRLRETVQNLQRQVGREKADQASLELKEKSLRNKLIVEMGITVSNKDNQIQSLSNKVRMLEEKYKMAAADIRAKDEFLKQHLLGRTDEVDVKEYAMKVLGNYEERFCSQSNEEKYQQEIEVLQKKLSLFERNW